MVSIETIVSNKKAHVLADQAVFSGSSFIATILLVRLLPAVDFGLYAGIILALYLLVSISNALVIQPLQVNYSRITNKKLYLSFAFWWQIVLILFIAFVIVILSALDIDVLRSFRLYTGVIVLLVFSFLLHDFFRKIFIARDGALHALLIDCTTGLALFFLLGLSFITGKLTLNHALYITSLAYLTGVISGIFLIRPSLRDVSSWRVFFTDHMVQGKWLFLTAIIQWWSGNLFVVASGISLGPIALGAFRLVQSLFGVLNVLLQSYENYILPQAASLFHSSVRESKYYLRNVSKKGIIFFGSVVLILFLFSEPVIRLAGGNKYVPYAYVVKGMAILYLIIFAGYPIRIAVRMMAMNDVFFAGYVGSFVFSLLSFNFLLNEWQLWGAILGLIINQLILILFWQYCLAKKKFVLWK